MSVLSMALLFFILTVVHIHIAPPTCALSTDDHLLRRVPRCTLGAVPVSFGASLKDPFGLGWSLVSLPIVPIIGTTEVTPVMSMIISPVIGSYAVP